MKFFIILLNRSIDLLKYPIAFLALLLTFELFNVLYEVSCYIYAHLSLYDDFFIGMALYILSWFLIFRHHGSWFFVIEHELTHTLFALLTFHRIHALVATDRGGGFVQYSGSGNGNWLILIAPYFFPTFSFVIIVFLHFFESQYYPILMMLLGYTLLYHLHSTIKETSRHQSDLKKVGLWFALLFLPAANLLAIIGILSAIPNDELQFTHIVEHLFQ